MGRLCWMWLLGTGTIHCRTVASAPFHRTMTGWGKIAGCSHDMFHQDFCTQASYRYPLWPKHLGQHKISADPNHTFCRPWHIGLPPVLHTLLAAVAHSLTCM